METTASKPAHTTPPPPLDAKGIRFDAQTSEWLAGDSFSAAGRVPIGGSDSELPSRVNYLCNLLSQKSVIHVGCCDHLPLVDQKIADGQWLHGRITQAASRCIGVDLNDEAVTTIRKKHGYTNLITADLTTALPAEIAQEKWQTLLLGEILEHVDDPVQFLKSLRSSCGAHTERIVLTVPNAFSLLTQKYAKRGFERINTDHRYWFTPYTLAKVLTRAGYTVESFRFVTYFPIRMSNLIKALRLRLHPCHRDCLIMVARL
jgi:2-polyprenyl-3-methyl-5-hydroxy-6-metoxy-1,4-benzoquinol methylase